MNVTNYFTITDECIKYIELIGRGGSDFSAFYGYISRGIVR